MATNKRFARRAGFYFGLALFLIATLLPFFVMLMTSFKSPKEAISLHPTLFPQHWTLEHYVDIFNPLIFPFVTYFRNSLVVSMVSSGVAVFIGILGAYALSKLRFKGRMTINASFYPTNVAGALDVIQNGAGSSEGCTQEYRPYTSNVCYRRYYRGDSKAWSSWEYDLTSAGGVINGFVEITGDARSVTIKPKTANNGYYFFGRKSDNTNHFYLGQGSNNSNNVTWGNYLTNSSISLVAGGVAVSGTITPSNWSNFDARYQAKNTANRASSGWFKDGSTGLIFQWGVARRSGDSTKIAFPIAFPNACLNVQLTLAWAGSFHDQNIYAQLIDRTAFNYIAGSGETMAYFFSVGY